MVPKILKKVAFLIPLAAYEDVSPRDGEHAQLERCQVLGHGQNENTPLNQRCVVVVHD